MSWIPKCLLHILHQHVVHIKAWRARWWWRSCIVNRLLSRFAWWRCRLEPGVISTSPGISLGFLLSRLASSQSVLVPSRLLGFRCGGNIAVALLACGHCGRWSDDWLHSLHGALPWNRRSHWGLLLSRWPHGVTQARHRNTRLLWSLLRWMVRGLRLRRMPLLELQQMRQVHGNIGCFERHGVAGRSVDPQEERLHSVRGGAAVVNQSLPHLVRIRRVVNPGNQISRNHLIAWAGLATSSVESLKYRVGLHVDDS